MVCLAAGVIKRSFSRNCGRLGWAPSPASFSGKAQKCTFFHFTPLHACQPTNCLNEKRSTDAQYKGQLDSPLQNEAATTILPVSGYKEQPAMNSFSLGNPVLSGVRECCRLYLQRAGAHIESRSPPRCLYFLVGLPCMVGAASLDELPLAGRGHRRGVGLVALRGGRSSV